MIEGGGAYAYRHKRVHSDMQLESHGGAHTGMYIAMRAPDGGGHAVGPFPERSRLAPAGLDGLHTRGARVALGDARRRVPARNAFGFP